MSNDERGRLHAQAWARVAGAAADAHAGARGVGAKRVLFDAIEFAATEARLDLAELVDAYLAGARELDVSEAWAQVEDFLARIARLQGDQLHRVVALPEWRDRLAVRIAAHDLVLAAHRMLGDQDEQIEQARLAVVEVLDAAAAAGATQDELDAFVRQLRTDQCDVASVVSAARWVVRERARTFGRTLPEAAWATVEEIARDIGAPGNVVQALVDDALDRGLLRPGARGLTITPAGLEHIERSTGIA